MHRKIDGSIATLLSLGGEAVAERYGVFVESIAASLLADPGSVGDFETYRAALRHGFSYYYWKWQERL